MAAPVITAISREDKAPRLFTHTTTLSPVLNKKESHVAFEYEKTADIEKQCILRAPDFRGRRDWLSGLVM